MLALCFPGPGALDFDEGRGVSGLVELRWDIVAVAVGWRGVPVVLGGVGGRPVEGLRGVAVVGSIAIFSRGLRNMACDKLRGHSCCGLGSTHDVVCESWTKIKGALICRNARFVVDALSHGSSVPRNIKQHHTS